MFMNSCKITYIYGLYEVGKEDEIRYVGKTNNPKLRRYLHLTRKDVNKEFIYDICSCLFIISISLGEFFGPIIAS